MKTDEIKESIFSPQNILRQVRIVHYLIWIGLSALIGALALWLGIWVLIVCGVLVLLRVVLIRIWLNRLIKNCRLIPIKAAKESHISLGQYSSEEIQQIVQDTAAQMHIRVPEHIFLYPSKLANAFVIIRGRKILALHTNILHILNKDELIAVIGHELAHLNYGCYPFPLFFALGLLIGIQPILKILQANEFIADYYSAKYNGLLPMINSLLKVYSRAQFFTDILEYLDYFKQTYNIPDESDIYLLSLIEERLPHILRDEKPIAYYGTEIMHKCIHRSPASMGRFMKMRHTKTMAKLRSRRKWKEHFKKLDWRIFDNHIKDLWIDDVELKEMYAQLKNNEAYRLFLPNTEIRDTIRTHPLLKERILFLVEALEPDLITAN